MQQKYIGFKYFLNMYSYFHVQKFSQHDNSNSMMARFMLLLKVHHFKLRWKFFISSWNSPLYNTCVLVIPAHLFNVTFGLIYCDLWVKYGKSKYLQVLYEKIRWGVVHKGYQPILPKSWPPVHPYCFPSTQENLPSETVP